MKKLALLSVLGMLCLNNTLLAQSNAHDIRTISAPLYVDAWLKQDVPLGKFINYKSSTATLSEFKDKVVILSFWFTSCSPCISMLPKEQDIQNLYANRIQIIPVTYESEEKVQNFLSKWKQKPIGFNLPIIVADTLLRKAFRNYYNPHYVWILPNGKMVAQTSDIFLSEVNIKNLLQIINNE